MSEAAQFGLDSIEIAQGPELPVPCERIIGAAGTGKTYYLQNKVKEDPTWGLLSATTGIASVNLGSVTINSVLRYSDVASLRDAYLCGRLSRTLHDIAQRVRHLVIEESSMADAVSLDLWYRGVQEANRFKDIVTPLGIILVGDLSQLPPVKGQWCFEAECWEHFAANTTRFDRVWRQDGGPFLDALNAMRFGRGRDAVDSLDGAGARWHTQMDAEFDGTTIVDMNDKVNRYNRLGLDRIKSPKFTVKSRRWGQQRSEWGENRKGEWGIPLAPEFKVGALVMVLSNAKDFSVVNGDTGHIREYDESRGVIEVELVRTGNVEPISAIVRSVDYSDRPSGYDAIDFPRLSDDSDSYLAKPHYQVKTRRYVMGQIEYMPLRLAWASTTHKSQSLTLDRCQVDFRGWMFKKAAMVYVAMSRCRTLEGLRLVGGKDRFIAQCHVDERILSWI